MPAGAKRGSVIGEEEKTDRALCWMAVVSRWIGLFQLGSTGIRMGGAKTMLLFE